MSDEPSMLRTIDWRSVFPFTQLFRAFRIAIHPAKMALALTAILLVYTVGRAMDAVWVERYRAVPGEVSLYERSESRAGFTDDVNDARAALRSQRLEVARSIAAEGKRLTPAEPQLADDASYGDLEDVVEDVRDAEADAARARYEAAPERTRAVAAQRDNDVRAAYADAGRKLDALDEARGRGLCLTFIEYQATQVDNVARGILSFNWTGPSGVLPSVGRFIFTGPGWALSKHPLYFTLLATFALLVWSVIGGAIARIAAVHVSQDEKISVRQALRFSSNKLMSFFAAPLMPLLLVGGIALLLAVIGRVSEIPYLGGLVTILVGALFVVLILVGVLMACALVGWVCGLGLMYPTIAVEGSDAFDAVSRSFSYVFARPWKVLAYVLIALVYGAITYLFLRFMVYLTLTVIHECLTFWTRSVGPAGSTSVANAWPGPAGMFDLAAHPTNANGLTFAESLGGGLAMFWVYLFVSLLGAYLLSYFVSVHTIMYYLLRYDVDATDIDDVYLEPSDDEFDDVIGDPAGNAAPATAGGGAAAAAGGVTAPATARPAEDVPPAVAPAVGPVAATGERASRPGESATIGATIVTPANDAPPTVITMTPPEGSRGGAPELIAPETPAHPSTLPPAEAPPTSVPRPELVQRSDPLPPPTPPPAGS